MRQEQIASAIAEHGRAAAGDSREHGAVDPRAQSVLREVLEERIRCGDRELHRQKSGSSDARKLPLDARIRRASPRERR